MKTKNDPEKHEITLELLRAIEKQINDQADGLARLRQQLSFLRLLSEGNEQPAHQQPESATLAPQIRAFHDGYQLILSYICGRYQVTPQDIHGPIRKERIVLPRWLLIYFVSEFLGATSIKLGELLNRDHGSILHAITRVNERASVETPFALEVKTIRQDLAPHFPDTANQQAA